MGKAAGSKISEPTLNQIQCAQVMGVSAVAFGKLDIPSRKQGTSLRYRVSDLIEHAVSKRTRRLEQKLTELGDKGSYESERLRLTRAQADGQELKNEIARGEVVPVDFAVFALGKVMNEAAGILDSLPLHIMRRHPEITNTAITGIKRELAKAMNAISSINETALPEMIDEYISQTS